MSETQRNAAGTFLEVLHQHLSSFCANLRAHTITDVQHNDRVSMLLKESFVDSFPAKDRPILQGICGDPTVFRVLRLPHCLMMQLIVLQVVAACAFVHLRVT